jgi:SAM-dependent methyltransferase
MPRTQERTYTASLIAKQRAWWKRLIDVQAPYRWNLRRLRLGYVLEIGCGIGRNLDHLRGSSVGIDHNLTSVQVARQRQLPAFTPEEFRRSAMNAPGLFDSLLFAHVLEHMPRTVAVELIREYRPYLKAGGRVVLITPQEAGFRSDATHVEFMDFKTLGDICREISAVDIRQYSFPLPRIAGTIFLYNEFVSIGRIQGLSN